MLKMTSTKSIKNNIIVSAAIISMSALFSTSVYAAGATGIDGTGDLHSGGSVAFSGFGLTSSYSDNPALDNSSWAHTGSWYTFHNHDAGNVSIMVRGDSGFAPGVSVWASGGAEFDGGTTSFGGEISTAGFGTPHSFNSTGAMGDSGTLWMADGLGGNMKETLGYAVSGPSHAVGGWGESIINGAHDVSLTNTFESGVSGGVGANHASLSFDGLSAGWYTVYVGGTNHSLSGGEFDVVITAVPEAETWAMLLIGLGIIGWRSRKLKNEKMIPA